ncbi:MAG: hypothetical protein ACKOVB_05330, partial [Terrabacter sp.]
MNCTQPGCSGTIVDGYCDVCGMAAGSTPAPLAGAASGASATGGAAASGTAGGSTGATGTLGAAGPGAGSLPVPPAPSSTAGPTVPEGGACLQPGCSGTIEAGYCNVCGTPADQQGIAAYAGPPAPEPAGTNGASAGNGTAGVGPEMSTRSAASSNLASAALGSKRARESGSVATRRTGGSQRLRAARL